ncbi:MAG TPA: S8 family serine peptidase [Ktedonobacteraceae bacterium]|nr:S8 family serine peptidase [Ktedonobacteraceae bacterium]
MRKFITTATSLFLVLFTLVFFTSTAFAAPITPTASTHITFTRACASPRAGQASCMALIANRHVNPNVDTPNANSPGGGPPYAPANFHNAYNLPTTASGTPTVAIVDAYNDPNLASDLATYRSQWGLPACTTSSGCLKIVNQSGGSSLPRNNASWGVEESLDLDMVSAICENCHILLVEASSSSLANLGTAVNEAVKLGAVAVSNSYGTGEFSSESSYCSSYYAHNNVAVTASSGDSGPGVNFPAVCSTVIGVGGTTLNSNGTETAWNTSSTEGAGGGCSAYISKPSWENSSVTGCSGRAVSDVSADADPNTGAYVYDSYGEGGWLEVGGTSESSPIIAAVFALAGNVSSTTYPASLPWSNYSSGCLFEVGGVRYAYQTGLGSPDGTGCF